MKSLMLAVAVSLMMQGPVWAAPLRVVTTTEDLAAIAREVGGPLVEVESLARGAQDPHYLETRPSMILKASRADLFIQVGLGLEAAWAPVLMTAARNPRIQPGGRGFLDASTAIEPLDIPSAPLDRSQGDVHSLGNPHYLLDPDNGRRVAHVIADKLTELLPERAEEIGRREQVFARGLDEAIAGWKARMKPHAGAVVVTYHRSWSYFARAFGLEVADYIEPKPGIPPSAAHLDQLIRQMKAKQIGFIIIEPYFSRSTPELLVRETGAQLLVLPPAVGAEGVTMYHALFDTLVDRLTAAFGRGG